MDKVQHIGEGKGRFRLLRTVKAGAEYIEQLYWKRLYHRSVKLGQELDWPLLIALITGLLLFLRGKCFGLTGVSNC